MRTRTLYDARSLRPKGLYSALSAETLEEGMMKVAKNVRWGDDFLMKSRLGITEVLDTTGLTAGTPIGLSPTTYRYGDYEVTLCAIQVSSTDVRIYYRKYDVTSDTLDATWTECTAASGKYGSTRGVAPDYGLVQFEGIPGPNGFTGVLVQFGSMNTIDSGTTTSTTSGKLIQSGQNFQTTVSEFDVVHNTTDDTRAYVVSVDSDTQLTLSMDIMVSGDAFTIYAPEYPLFINFAQGYTAAPVRRVTPPTSARNAVPEPGVSGYLKVATGGTDPDDDGGTLDVTAPVTSWSGEKYWSFAANATGSTGDWAIMRILETADFSGGGQVIMLFDTDNDAYLQQEFTLTNRLDTGTNTTATANKLIDSGATWSGLVEAGDWVVNSTDSLWATVSSVDSNIQLTLDTNIFPTDTGDTYYIVRPIIIHDPSDATSPINEAFEVPADGSTRVIVFPIPPTATATAIDGLRITLRDTAASVASGDSFNIYWIAAGGNVPGGAEYGLAFGSSGSGAESPGIREKNSVISTNSSFFSDDYYAGIRNGETVQLKINRSGSSARPGFLMPFDPRIGFTVKVPYFAPSSGYVNNVSGASSGFADTCTVYRRDPGETEFYRVADIRVAEYDSVTDNRWETNSTLFSSSTAWGERAYFSDTVSVENKNFNKKMPSGMNEPVPAGQAMIAASKRLMVAAYSGVGDSATQSLVMVSEDGNPTRFRTIPRIENGVPDPYDGYSVPLDEPVRKFFDVSASIVGTSNVFTLTDRSLFALNGPVARRISSMGCIAPDTVHEKDGMTFFVDDENQLQVMTGTLENLSKHSVSDLLDTAPAAKRQYMAGIYNKGRYYLAMPENDSNKNFRVLVWHEKVGFESFDSYPVARGIVAFLQWNVNGASKIYAMCDDMVVYEFGAGFTDDGTAIGIQLQFADHMGPKWDSEVMVGTCGIVADDSTATVTTTRTPLASNAAAVTGTIDLNGSGARTYRYDTASSGPTDPGVSDTAVRFSVSANAPTGAQITIRSLVVQEEEYHHGLADR